MEIHQIFCQFVCLIGYIIGSEEKDQKMKNLTSEFIEEISKFLCSLLWIFGYMCFLLNLLDLTNRELMSLTTKAVFVIKVINFVLKNNEWQYIYNEIKELVGGQTKVVSLQRVFTQIYIRWYRIDCRNNKRNDWIMHAFQSVASINLIFESYFLMLMFITEFNIFRHRLSAPQTKYDKNSTLNKRMELINQILSYCHQNDLFDLIKKKFTNDFDVFMTFLKASDRL